MLFRWQAGRQRSGYQKMCFARARWPFSFDCYLLKFNMGDEVPPHVDQVPSGRHFRINFVLKKAKRGGEFICQNPIYESSRVKFFRPDVSQHEVTKVEQGSRYVLSLGWVRQA